MSEYIELSHPIVDGMKTYQGLPKPIICDYFSREESRNHYTDGSSFQIGQVEMVGNTGTYMDCPFHRYAKGQDFTQIGLSQLADLPGILIQAPYTESKAIDRSVFQDRDLAGKAVLVHTGWSEWWGQEAYFSGHPYLTATAAQYLVEHQVKIVGIDAYNIDDTGTSARPVHTILLGNGILIIEHMTNLKSLRGSTFRFTSTPPMIEGMGSFPVRAYATLVG